MNGIICINKPSGWTSFDVVAKVRGITHTRKVGHAGTLDPMATGVLPLFLGPATKVCDIMPNSDKGYLARFRFGMTTDTLDITGTVLKNEPSHVSRAELEQVLEAFRGTILQLPPMYSAVQINGRRLYDIARSGETVERKPRKVTVSKLMLRAFDEQTQEGELEVLCSKGTYIRSLCSDIGDKLGCGAVLTSLTRHCSGDFTLQDCLTLGELQQAADRGELEQRLLPIEKVFESFPAIYLNRTQAVKFQNGVKLDLNRVRFQNADGFHRVFNQDKVFLGLASLNLEEMELKIEKMFKRD